MIKDKEIIRQGYKPYPKLLVINENFMNKVFSLKKDLVANAQRTFYKMELADVLHDEKCFFNEFYNLKEVYYYDSYMNFINKFIPLRVKKVSPLELPISINNSQEDYCSGNILFNCRLFPKKVIYLGIILNGSVCELTSAVLAHEVTHSQLIDVKQKHGSYYDSEALPIFNELLHSFTIDSSEKILKFLEYQIINEICYSSFNLYYKKRDKQILKRDELLDDSKYIISEIKALNMFRDYYYESTETKRLIIKLVQQVFDEKISEEMLFRELGIKRQVDISQSLSKYLRR